VISVPLDAADALVEIDPETATNVPTHTTDDAINAPNFLENNLFTLVSPK
jgi:hypothetical protein